LPSRADRNSVILSMRRSPKTINALIRRRLCQGRYQCPKTLACGALTIVPYRNVVCRSGPASL
jgi:hypothetical protein